MELRSFNSLNKKPLHRLGEVFLSMLVFSFVVSFGITGSSLCFQGEEKEL